MAAGDYVIVINASGKHSNQGESADANRAAARLVDELKASGHQIRSAVFMPGGVMAENIEGGEQVYAGRFAAPPAPPAAASDAAAPAAPAAAPEAPAAAPEAGKKK